MVRLSSLRDFCRQPCLEFFFSFLKLNETVNYSFDRVKLPLAVFGDALLYHWNYENETRKAFGVHIVTLYTRLYVKYTLSLISTPPILVTYNGYFFSTAVYIDEK